MKLTSLIAAALIASAASSTTQHAAADTGPCAPRSVTLYFADGETALTAQAEAVIDTLAETVAGCRVVTVQTRVTAMDNPGLVTARTDAVTTALASAGLAASAPTQLTSASAHEDARHPAARAAHVSLSLAPPRTS